MIRDSVWCPWKGHENKTNSELPIDKLDDVRRLNWNYSNELSFAIFIIRNT